MGCREHKDEGVDPIPTFNVVVLGLEGVGKTAILNRLRGDLEHEGNEELGIYSFTLNKESKVIVFQVAGKAYKTWHNYLLTCNIVLFVVDIADQSHKDRIPSLLSSIDEQLHERAKIIIVFNKIDKIMGNCQEDEDKLKFDELAIDCFKHEVITCKCSAKSKVGIVDMMKKVNGLCKSLH